MPTLLVVVEQGGRTELGWSRGVDKCACTLEPMVLLSVWSNYFALAAKNASWVHYFAAPCCILKEYFHHQFSARLFSEAPSELSCVTQTGAEGWCVAGCPSEPIIFNEMQSDQSSWLLWNDTQSLCAAGICPETLHWTLHSGWRSADTWHWSRRSLFSLMILHK